MKSSAAGLAPFAVLLLAAVVLSSPAGARSTSHDMPVADAVASEVGKKKLLDVPFYFKGQKHPAVAEVKAEGTTHKSTSGVFRSDETACQIAFLSAVIQLQTRAKELGATAIIDIESTTRGESLSSPDKYRCVAGGAVVHSGLKGTFVTLK